MTLLTSFPDCVCDAQARAGRLATVAEALATIPRIARPVPGTEQVSLAAARGRVLAEPVLARAAMPPFDNSAMDGYALCSTALEGDGPWTLPIAGRIAAGDAPGAPLRGTGAVRIFTGAPLPSGADAVVMQEQVVREGNRIQLAQRPERGQNVRRAGEDIAKGSPVLGAGTRLGVRDIAAAAGAGASTLCVHRKVRVAFLATGNEISAPGAELSEGHIWDVNSPMMLAALRSAGGSVIAEATAADRPDALTRQLVRMADASDLVVTAGGISVGEEDHMTAAVAAAGGRFAVSGVAIKPGKPVCLGRIGRAAWLGLPGNPVSAFVTWCIFGLPLIAALAGDARLEAAPELAVNASPLPHKPGRTEFRPAVLAGRDAEGRRLVRTLPATHSARLGPLAAADGLIEIPAAADTLPEGTLVKFRPFTDGACVG